MKGSITDAQFRYSKDKIMQTVWNQRILPYLDNPLYEVYLKMQCYNSSLNKMQLGRSISITFINDLYNLFRNDTVIGLMKW